MPRSSMGKSPLSVGSRQIATRTTSPDCSGWARAAAIGVTASATSRKKRVSTDLDDRVRVNRLGVEGVR